MKLAEDKKPHLQHEFHDKESSCDDFGNLAEKTTYLKCRKDDEATLRDFIVIN